MGASTVPHNHPRGATPARALKKLFGFLLMSSGAVLGGCVKDPVSATPSPSHSELLFTLEIHPRGITMAIGDSVALTATPRNILNEPMTIPDTAPVQYVSSNVLRATVGADGMVRGKGATPFNATTGQTPVLIIATWKFGTVTKKDTVFVAVTATAPANPVASLSITPEPYPIDSTWLGWNPFAVKRIAVRATTATGESVPGVFATLSTTRRRQRVVDGMVPATRVLDMSKFFAGQRFWLFAEASLYGVFLQDSVQYLAIDPAFAPINLSRDIGGVTRLSSDSMTAAPCAMVSFSTQLTDSVRVRFDDPSQTTVCTAGDETGDFILPPNGDATRKFRVGRYGFQVRRLDDTPFTPAVTGIIRVRDHTQF